MYLSEIGVLVMDQFISKKILDELSYTSSLGRSLQISLSKTPLEDILNDISKYRTSYMDILNYKKI